MNHEAWSGVDAYLTGRLLPPDPALDGALRACEAAGLPAIQVAPNQGALLHILARAVGARRILEIGTLGGYSTIWLARALPPSGRLVTIEKDPAHARVARANLAAAGLAAVVEVREGEALGELPRLADQPPFDVVFIDADKPSMPAYFEWSLRLTRAGGLVIADNVVREGAVADPANTDPAVLGVRRMLDMMGNTPRVVATAIQTVGVKGYDGLAVALVV
jgi:predicted O-methyltransferase YrrM